MDMMLKILENEIASEWPESLRIINLKEVTLKFWGFKKCDEIKLMLNINLEDGSHPLHKIQSRECIEQDTISNQTVVILQTRTQTLSPSNYFKIMLFIPRNWV